MIAQPYIDKHMGCIVHITQTLMFIILDIYSIGSLNDDVNEYTYNINEIKIAPSKINFLCYFSKLINSYDSLYSCI